MGRQSLLFVSFVFVCASAFALPPERGRSYEVGAQESAPLIRVGLFTDAFIISRQEMREES